MSMRVICFLILANAAMLAQSSPDAFVRRPVASGVTPSVSRPDPAFQKKIAQGYGKLPLSFEANAGQSDPQVKFISRSTGYTLFLTGDEAVFTLSDSEPKDDAKSIGRQPRAAPHTLTTNAVLRMKLRNANLGATVAGADELPGKSNYFIGNDPKKWRTDVPQYEKVKYAGIYPGIDLVYYGNQRQLEYDFVVAPGADPRRIEFDVSGARRIRRDKSGDLILPLTDREIRWRKPTVYQEHDGTRQQIEGRYVIKHGRRVGFEVASYDSHKPLIIDPAVSYSTYLGGATNLSSAYAVAVDTSGNAYLTGYTRAWDFPVTPGAFQTTCPSGQGEYGCGTWGAAFITKLNPTGTALVYSTYLGGNEGTEGFAIAIDGSGDAYVTGGTDASNFPTTPGAFQTTCGSCGYYQGLGDAFVTELNPTGSALVYSTYLGGDTPNQYFNNSLAGSIAIDTSGNVYVSGYTNFGGFPVTPGAFQTKCGSCHAGPELDSPFVTKFNPALSTLLYSTFLGGSGGDEAADIAVDASGDAYLTGTTQSTDFPVTPGAFQTTCSQPYCWDIFVTELNPTGSSLLYSSYLGGGITNGTGQAQFGTGIVIDSDGDAYVTGDTGSPTFPTTPGAFQTTCHGCVNGGSNAFVTEFNPSESALIYSTYLGGSNGDQASGIALDAAGDIYLSGETYSIDFPTSPGAFQTCATCNIGEWRAFVSELNPTGSGLVYSTYLTGTNGSGAKRIVLDAVGGIYVVGGTGSADFPITPGAFQTTCAGGCNYGSAFVTKFVPGDQVWPLSLSFGSEPLDVASSPQNTALTNSGTTALSITSITFTGTNNGDFSETDNCGTSLAAGESCNIAVTFTPTGNGARDAVLNVTDDARNGPQSVALSGTGLPPTVTLLPARLNFNSQGVGTTSQPMSVMLSTNGTLSISSIATSAPFAQTNNCGTGLAAGGSCIINVTFAPPVLGMQNGALTVTDNAPGSPQTVALSGIGVTPISLAPPSLNFGSQTVGITSLPLVSTLTNIGNVSVTLASIAVTGVNSNVFAQMNNCPANLPPNGSCTISMTFTPTMLGSDSAAVVITDNAPGSPQIMALTGTGNGPIVSLSPPTVTFPSQYVGTSGLPQTVTVTNTGTSTLTITNAATSASDFGTLSNCTNSVQPGTNCTIGVFFDPTASGTRTGTLAITDNAGGSPQMVMLSGSGQDFSMSSSGSATASVSPGQTATYTVAVAPGGGFKQTVSLACSGAPAGSTCSVPNSVTLNGSTPTMVTVMVMTSATSGSLARQGGNRLALWLTISVLPGLVILSTTGTGRRYRSRLFYRLVLACVFSLAITWAGCGGSTSSGGGTNGTYNLVVAGTFSSGSTTLTHDTKLTLVVQ
jgi:hypothetical protein